MSLVLSFSVLFPPDICITFQRIDCYLVYAYHVIIQPWRSSGEEKESHPSTGPSIQNKFDKYLVNWLMHESWQNRFSFKDYVLEKFLDHITIKEVVVS